MSELGSSFVQEGGPYEWMKLCYGRLTAGFGAVLYWITNPLWVGGTLCFLASSAFSEYFIHLGGPEIGFLGDIPLADLLFKLAFIWISIVVAIAALDRGKWIPNFGAVCRAFVLLFFSFTVLIYAFKHGINGFGFKDFIPGATSVSGTAGLPRSRAAAALQLRRLRARERSGRGDGRSAEGRAEVGHPQRDRDRHPVLAADLRHPRRAAHGQDQGHRRLRRSGQRRLRRRLRGRGRHAREVHGRARSSSR